MWRTTGDIRDVVDAVVDPQAHQDRAEGDAEDVQIADGFGGVAHGPDRSQDERHRGQQGVAQAAEAGHQHQEYAAQRQKSDDGHGRLAQPHFVVFHHGQAGQADLDARETRPLPGPRSTAGLPPRRCSARNFELRWPSARSTGTPARCVRRSASSSDMPPRRGRPFPPENSTCSATAIDTHRLTQGGHQAGHPFRLALLGRLQDLVRFRGRSSDHARRRRRASHPRGRGPGSPSDRPC